MLPNHFADRAVLHRIAAQPTAGQPVRHVRRGQAAVLHSKHLLNKQLKKNTIILTFTCL